MNQENHDIDERIKKQQEILFELDKHYQDCTMDLIKQVDQLEQMLVDLKKSTPGSNVTSTQGHSPNVNNNGNQLSRPTEKNLFSSVMDIQ